MPKPRPKPASARPSEMSTIRKIRPLALGEGGSTPLGNSIGEAAGEGTDSYGDGDAAICTWSAVTCVTFYYGPNLFVPS